MKSITVKGKYEGQLRCSLVHNGSQSLINTDAPIDNNGKGESFSPTDLVAAALGSCMLTIIGIRANSKRIEIGNPEFSILKIMGESPRKIEEIQLEINLPDSITQKDRVYLEKEGLNCPVALSLNKDLKQNVSFKYI